MKITGKELKECTQSLTKILGKEMDFKLSYRIRKIAKKTKAEIDDLEEARFSLIKKYGEKIAKTNAYQVKEEHLDICTKEIDELLAIEIDLDISLIPYEVIEKAKIELSPIDVALLERFIEEEKEVVPVNKPKQNKEE